MQAKFMHTHTKGTQQEVREQTSVHDAIRVKEVQRHQEDLHELSGNVLVVVLLFYNPIEQFSAIDNFSHERIVFGVVVKCEEVHHVRMVNGLQNRHFL